MALESIAALSFAGNIVQFIGTGVKLFSTSRDLYKSSTGALAESIELEAIAKSMKKFFKHLMETPPSEHQISLEDSGLISLAQSCKNIAEELIEVLEKLKIRGSKKKKWESFRVALSAIWKSKEIENMAKRLDFASRQLTTCITYILHIEQSSISASFEQIVKANWQQDSGRTSEFENMRLGMLETLRETREYDEKLQKEREKKILEENGEVKDEVLRSLVDTAVTKTLERLSSRFNHLKDLVWKSTTEYHVINSLSHTGMAVRYEKIVNAHARTFEWIFQNYTQDKQRHHGKTFIEWLTHGTGIFWVTGKAGSGKSTLMKFLCNHPLARTTLENWSGERKLIIASFYFWYAGTEAQKSQEGLLRSLLFEIFRQCPALIPIALPQHWDPTLPRSSSSITWTRSELITAFSRLSQHPTLTSVFCFFIDGLDEFDGDHNDIVALIQSFAKSDSIKWCLSSRPWNVFEAAFGNGLYPSCRLEDLTRQDIILYVHDKIKENNAFRRLNDRDGIACAGLVNEIVEKAQGVFLWVFLAIRSLTAGLQNADRIIDLKKRLLRFPSDLEDYFRHMLDSIDDTYREQTAQTFCLALQTSEPLSLMTYAMVDELEFDPSYALNCKIRSMSAEEIISRHSDMKLRINARCKDLLEVAPVHREIRPSFDFSDKEPIFHSSQASFADFQVDFLHRTVRDFLHTKEIYDWVLKNVSCSFNVDQILCAAFEAQAKSIPLHGENFHVELQPLVDGMTQYTRNIASPIQLVECFQKVLSQRLIQDSKFIQLDDDELFLDFAEVYDGSFATSLRLLCCAPVAFLVQRGLQQYVSNKMDDRQGDLSLYHDEAQLFSSVMYPYEDIIISDKPQTRYNMLRLLISKGLDPPTQAQVDLELPENLCSEVYDAWLEKAQNLELSHSSYSHELGPRMHQWVMYVLKALRLWLLDDSPYRAILCETVETFLQRGINPNWVYGKHTLWTYFTTCLHSDWTKGVLYSATSQKCTFGVAKGFYRHGASRYQIIMHDAIDDVPVNAEDIQSIPDLESIKYKTERDGPRFLDAHAAIAHMISPDLMRELECVGNEKS